MPLRLPFRAVFAAFAVALSCSACLLALLGGQHLKDAVAGLQVQLEHLAMRYRHRVVGAPFCGFIQGCSLRR
jgi:hypothetical protein